MPGTARASLDWHYRGMQTLIMDNELVRMVFLVDKGSDMMELVYKPLNIDVLWHAPTGYRSSLDHGSRFETPESGFTDRYGGGWQDILPTTGSGPVDMHGARFGLHGESAVLPWKATIVEGEEWSGTASAILALEGLRYPYKVQKTVTLRDGVSRINITEKLTNIGRQRLGFDWLQHPSFGEPFLAPGCKIRLPQGSRTKNVEAINPRGRVAGGEFGWPEVSAKRDKGGGGTIDLSVVPTRDVVAEETTFIRVNEGWYDLTNPVLGLRVGMRWDASVFPWLWFWQNYGTPDYPYYGRAWNVALEPSSGLPTIMDTSEQRRPLTLDGGESLSTELEVLLEPLETSRDAN